MDPNNAYSYSNSNNYASLPRSNVSKKDSYYTICALSACQVTGAYIYAVPSPNLLEAKVSDVDEPLVFRKEISSDGNFNTVDVLHPATPFFLYANPEFIRLASHHPLPEQVAGYLIDFALIPGTQFSTDDLAGTLVNQTNLAWTMMAGPGIKFF